MFGLNLKKFLGIAVMLVLIVSFGFMVYVMYTMSYSTAYVFDKDGKTYTAVVKTEGDEAIEVWNNKKLFFIVPSVLNLVSIGLLGLLVFT